MNFSPILSHRGTSSLVNRSVFSFGVAILVSLSGSQSYPRVSSVSNRSPEVKVCDRVAQEVMPPTINEETYYDVLDRVFPRDILTNHKPRYVFVLRYEPAFGAESQITIAEQAGKPEVIKYTSLDGSIEAKLNEILRRTHREDAKRMAQQIRVQKEYLETSPDLIKQLHQSFFDLLRSSEKERLSEGKDTITITADGTAYRLWYRGETQVQTDFVGSNVDSPTGSEEPRLLDWMKGLYHKVVTSPQTSRR
jgi:hypothetical protein